MVMVVFEEVCQRLPLLKGDDGQKDVAGQGEVERFAGIASANFPAVSPEEQFAEKLHAFTLPRVGRENTRVRDLVDLVLLIERTRLDVARLPKAIRETFQRRKTHGIPATLASPPASWPTPFAEMARECGIAVDMEAHFGVVQQFFSRLHL